MPRAPAPLCLPALLLVALPWFSSAAFAQEGPAPAVAQETTPAERSRLLVLDLASNGVEDDVVKTVSGLLAVELSRYEEFDVLTSGDIRRTLELETERQAAGCDDASCLSELAGALGAELVIYGDAGKLGSLLVVNLNLFDTKAVRSVGRVSVRAKTLEDVPALLRPKLADLLAPWYEAHGLSFVRPEEPVASETALPGVVPWAVAGTGGALVVVGAALATVGALPWLAFQQHAEQLSVLESEGSSTLSAAREAYAAQERARADWQTWGGPLVVGGGLLVAGGVATAAGGAVWALLPSDGGAAE